MFQFLEDCQPTGIIDFIQVYEKKKKEKKEKEKEKKK